MQVRVTLMQKKRREQKKKFVRGVSRKFFFSVAESTENNERTL